MEKEYDEECEKGHWGCTNTEHYSHPQLSERDSVIMKQLDQIEIEIANLKRTRDRWMEVLATVEKKEHNPLV